MCFTNSKKLGMNLLMNFILPRKDWMSLFYLGIDSFWIASTLTESIVTPSAKTMWPRSFPSLRENRDFLGFNDIPYLLQFINTFLKCCKWSWWLWSKLLGYPNLSAQTYLLALQKLGPWLSKNYPQHSLAQMAFTHSLTRLLVTIA